MPKPINSSSYDLMPEQLEAARYEPGLHTFLEGPAGSGKTTAAIAFLLNLLEAGIPAAQILVLVPQRALASPYTAALNAAPLAGGQVSVLTAGGLARRMVELFWPLVAKRAGFAHPERPPSFLTLETAQYFMAHLVRPLFAEGAFDSVAIDRNRLYSQVIDNLNKAAVTGFPHTQIGERLSAAWGGKSSQLRVFADAQRCASLFRAFCLEHNLLDFSLQVELFRDHLRPALLCREYLRRSYRHLIADNVEEDTPFAHDLALEWLPDLDSALVVFDQNAGYRRFLGADPASAARLADGCERRLELRGSLVTPEPLAEFGRRLGAALERPGVSAPAGLEWASAADMAPGNELRFHPQMLDWVAGRVHGLVQDGVAPGEIAILAPILPDSLRFALTDRLEKLGVPYRSHRPSRALSAEPAARCLLTLARLAHPDWSLRPAASEVVHALVQAIEGLDLVRAKLLAEIVYRPRDGKLSTFQQIKPEVQERITYLLGERYERLRAWLAAYAAEPAAELDTFFSRVFGELLSQPGFGFHSNLGAGQVAANLIESAQKFRWSVENIAAISAGAIGKEYLALVQEGVIAAAYLPNWQSTTPDAVFIAPAYTFLLNNHPVAHQFWLDVSSNAWFERLYQPLTHPIVLSQSWPAGRLWTDADEFEYNRETLHRLILGLLRRAGAQVHLVYSQLNEGGYEQKGMLLRSVYQIQIEEGRDG